jgi:hypothetical protein
MQLTMKILRQILLFFFAAVIPSFAQTTAVVQTSVARMPNAVKVCAENASLTAMPVGTVYQFGTGTTWTPAATSTATVPKMPFLVTFTNFPFDPAPNVLKELDVQQQAKAYAVTCGGVTTQIPALVVTPIAPVITWATPSAVPVGTTLSPTQLNATANTPGTFVYTPPAGTVLSTVGTTALSVVFTPTDTVHFTTGKASVSLTVSGKIPVSSFPATCITYSDSSFNCTQTGPATVVSQ